MLRISMNFPERLIFLPYYAFFEIAFACRQTAFLNFLRVIQLWSPFSNKAAGSDSSSFLILGRCLDVMELFDVIGDFGPWQRRIFIVLFLMNVLGIFQNFSITFLAPNMDFQCVEPPSYGKENTSKIALSLDDRCQVQVGLNETVPCTRWEYDTSQTSQTIVSEWDLVCDREWLVSLAKSVYMIGFLLSVSFFGQVSDCVGRFPALVMCYVITTTAMFLSLLSKSYLMFIILRFFQAFGRTGITAVGFVLLLETTGSQYREGIGIAIQLGWAVGYVLLPGVAYFIRNWFWFQLFASVCFLPFLLAYKMMPESPRWLASRGRTKKLEKVLIKAAAVNGKEFKGDIMDLDIFENNKEMEEKKAETIIDVLKMPNMRSSLFKMIYLWIVHAFLYYGVSYNTNDLAGNPYLNFFIAGVIEFPCRSIVFFILKKLGRRPIIVLSMTVCGLAFGAMIFVPSDLPWLSTTFAMVGKFCVTASFAVLYIYTAEMFPTGVRNVTFGACSMFARVGSILAPFVKELGKATHVSVPNVLYVSLALSCTLLVLFLPETRGLKMPDSLQEGEELGRKPEKMKENTDPKPPDSEVTSHM